MLSDAGQLFLVDDTFGSARLVRFPRDAQVLRTARSRTSGENLFVVLLVIAPPSQELEPPTNPGRFTVEYRWSGSGPFIGEARVIEILGDGRYRLERLEGTAFLNEASIFAEEQLRLPAPVARSA